MTALEIKLAIGAAVLAVSLAAFAWYHHHVILEGEAKIEASDAKATQAAKDKADADTAHNLTLSTQAKQAADHEQQAIAYYARDHPVGDVRVCHATNNSGSAVPKASTVASGTQGASPRPDMVPAVPDATPGPDIGPGLTELVSAASRLATLDAERQQR